MENNDQVCKNATAESYGEKLKEIEKAMRRIKMCPENAIQYERDGHLVIVHTAPSAFSVSKK